MKAESATNAKVHFGRLLDSVAKEPVTIQKSGRNVAVVMSYEEYEQLSSLSNKYWAEKAAKADKSGYIGGQSSEDLLDDLLNAED